MTAAERRRESELAAVRRSLQEAERELRQHQALADEARAEKAAAVEDEAAFSEAAAKLRRHADAVERYELLVPKRRQDVAAIEHKLAAARFAAATEEAAAAYSAAAKLSSRFGSTIAKVASVAAELVEARQAADDAYARARELAPEGETVELPASADEPAWPDVAALVELLTAGPRRPVAEAAALSAHRAAKHARMREEQIRAAVRDALRVPAAATARLASRVSRLPAEDRAEATRRLEAAQAFARKQGRPVGDSDVEQFIVGAARATRGG